MVRTGRSVTTSTVRLIDVGLSVIAGDIVRPVGFCAINGPDNVEAADRRGSRGEGATTGAILAWHSARAPQRAVRRKQ